LAVKIQTTPQFDKWLRRLRDKRGQAQILSRLMRLEDGFFGDVKSVGSAVSEMRIDVGPGYRVYFTRLGNVTVLLLAGGDKQTQSRDIVLARKLAREWKEGANEPEA
jgi:putative addiction module killer protein